MQKHSCLGYIRNKIKIQEPFFLFLILQADFFKALSILGFCVSTSSTLPCKYAQTCTLFKVSMEHQGQRRSLSVIDIFYKMNSLLSSVRKYGYSITLLLLSLSILLLLSSLRLSCAYLQTNTLRLYQPITFDVGTNAISVHGRRIEELIWLVL